VNKPFNGEKRNHRTAENYENQTTATNFFRDLFRVHAFLRRFAESDLSWLFSCFR